MEHSSDGQNLPLFQRMVSDADIRNWEDEQGVSAFRTLPSRFQIGDKVSIRFRPDLVVNEAEILNVKFTESKVLYDIEVFINFDGTENHPAGYTTTRFYNVDSTIVGEF